MPYKHNEPRRHKFKKTKYKVTNWPEYNEALRSRGNINIWFSDEAIADWREPRKNYSGRGRPKEYSDVAVQTSLFIRQLFRLPLRQTQGFIESFIELLDLPIVMMDFSNISKRSNGLKFESLVSEIEPGSHIIVDSTGLKVYGKGEWHQEKHNVCAGRIWRKLHIAVDEKHQILSCELTSNDVGDTTALPELLKLLDEFDKFIADGAYDGDPTYELVKRNSPFAECIIPPSRNAAIDPNNPERNDHINHIDDHGRLDWQEEHGYGLRSYVELAIQRYKRIFGNTLKARTLQNQKAEAQASVRLLNKMTLLGMPISVKIK